MLSAAMISSWLLGLPARSSDRAAEHGDLRGQRQGPAARPAPGRCGTAGTWSELRCRHRLYPSEYDPSGRQACRQCRSPSSSDRWMKPTTSASSTRNLDASTSFTASRPVCVLERHRDVGAVDDLRLLVGVVGDAGAGIPELRRGDIHDQARRAGHHPCPGWHPCASVLPARSVACEVPGVGALVQRW